MWVAAVTEASNLEQLVIVTSRTTRKNQSGDCEATLPTCLGTPSMGVNLWGASPLYETGSLKEDHHAKWITPIDKVRGEGNCGAATIRGKEAVSQDLRGYEQKRHTRPGCRGEWARCHKAVPRKAAR